VTWEEFLTKLKAAGGSTDMQTNQTGRYPFLFHHSRGQALKDVVIYAYLGSTSGGVLSSPPRDWSTTELILADYKALRDHGGYFNDTLQALA
jgi:hypothetical protein